jgi:hypothetical protein
MEIPEDVGDQFQSLDRSRFMKIKEAEFRPGYDLIGLKYLRNKAGNERDLRELYRGRAPYELLQNADDARATRAVFVLSHGGLAFAHDGSWFSVQNFRSLADGWSDKDPKQCIGHKGLGFRSVLDITPAPHVLKVGPTDFFGFKFTWALNNGHIQEALQRQPSLRRQYQQWSQHGQSCCPVMAIPGEARRKALGLGGLIYDQLVEGHFNGNFTTMFWFPGNDPEIDKKVYGELSPVPLVSSDTGRTSRAFAAADFFA